MNSAAPRLQSFLRELPLFERMDPSALERTAAGANEENAPRRTVIFKTRDPSRGLFVVVSGQVKLALQGAHGGERVVELVAPGGVFGEIAVLSGRHLLIAETLTDVQLVHFPKALVLAEMERTPEFTRGIISIMSRRFEQLLGALEDCTLHSGTERVIRYLLNSLPPGAVNGHAVLTLPVKKGVIASQLNLTHEHFSRLLRELATAALIEVDGRRVRIADVERLRAYGLN
jgi:CRP/FNR family transcriptional regulator, dissimilatory nitrate respiration regulator